MAHKLTKTRPTRRLRKTAPARSNAGGALRGQARAAQVHALNAARRAGRIRPGRVPGVAFPLPTPGVTRGAGGAIIGVGPHPSRGRPGPGAVSGFPSSGTSTLRKIKPPVPSGRTGPGVTSGFTSSGTISRQLRRSRRTGY